MTLTTSATLTVTHTESVTINGVDHGVSNVSTFTVSAVEHKIVYLDAGVGAGYDYPLLAFSAARTDPSGTPSSLGLPMAGSFVETDVRYLRITNKGTGSGVQLVLRDSADNATAVTLGPSESFIMSMRGDTLTDADHGTVKALQGGITATATVPTEVTSTLVKLSEIRAFADVTNTAESPAPSEIPIEVFVASQPSF